MNCVEVTGSRSHGYGCTGVLIGPGVYKHILAHRLAFERAWGLKVPTGMSVRHSCDNPSCVNPLHLMLGTHTDNMQDKVQRGRARGRFSDVEHCALGHEFDGRKRLKDGRTWRYCKTCQREYSRRRGVRPK